MRDRQILLGRYLDQVPVVPRIGKDGGVCDVAAIHGPDRRRPVVVLPENIGLAVAVEVAWGAVAAEVRSRPLRPYSRCSQDHAKNVRTIGHAG